MELGKKIFIPGICFSILLIVLLPKIIASSQGLPYLHFWDEPILGTGAINALKSGHFLPIQFEALYGGFLRYMAILNDYLYFSHLKNVDPTVNSLDDILTPLNGLEHSVSHSGFYQINRIFVSFLDSIGFVFLFLIGYNRYGVFHGLIACGIWASAVAYFDQSYLVLPNHTLVMLVTATTYFAFKFHQSKSLKYLLLSFVFSHA